jgi:hypothetical protein
VRLERLGLEVAAPVRYLSATGQHAYQLPATLARPGGAPAALDHVTLAALLGKELALAEVAAGGSPAASTTPWPAGRARPAPCSPAETRRRLAAGAAPSGG